MTHIFRLGQRSVLWLVLLLWVGISTATPHCTYLFSSLDSTLSSFAMNQSGIAVPRDAPDGTIIWQDSFSTLLFECDSVSTHEASQPLIRLELLPQGNAQGGYEIGVEIAGEHGENQIQYWTQATRIINIPNTCQPGNTHCRITYRARMLVRKKGSWNANQQRPTFVLFRVYDTSNNLIREFSLENLKSSIRPLACSVEARFEPDHLYFGTLTATSDRKNIDSADHGYLETQLILQRSCKDEAVKIAGYFTSKHGLVYGPTHTASARLNTSDGAFSGIVASIMKKNGEHIYFNQKTHLTEFAGIDQARSVPLTILLSKPPEAEVIPGIFEGAISVDLIYE